MLRSWCCYLCLAAGVMLVEALANAAEFRIGERTFTLPEGFTIERVAGPPLVDRPIVADFDDQGRLYVADSSGSNEPVQKQLAERTHRVVRLEDRDGDGRYDAATVFADRLMLPQGAMWHNGSLYVAAPPSIWKLTDTDGDGVADRREEWFAGKTLTGCANDLHGPYLGPDGWIYWTKGAFAEQRYERPGRPPLVTRAAHIFRSRPDGSDIEAVMTGGMDNPVEVVFTPGGERIFTTTFFEHPAGGRRDGLVHAIYGGVYGKVHGVIDGHPRTSPDVMPVLLHLGPAAPAGLTRYQGEVFGAAYRDNLFAALFNLNKITRHVLVADGATFRTQDEDFLVCNHRDFHPTDVLEDADGSLLVLDTGGWYRLCCPTSQIGKPEVLGGIYRIRRIGAPRVDDPRGTKLDWRAEPAALAGRLGDPRPAIRQRALEELALRGDEALAALEHALTAASVPPGDATARQGGVWAATRIDSPAARRLIRTALADPDETVRQAAIHSASVLRDAAAVPQLIEFLTHESPHHRRAAAEALGRLGERRAVPALLAGLESVTDTVLRHSLIHALIELGDVEGTAVGLAHNDPLVRSGAMIALDQMPGGKLTPEAVAAELAGSEPLARQAASWIIARRPAWGDVLVGHFRRHLATDPPADPAALGESQQLVRQLAALSRGAAVQQLLAEAVADGARPAAARRIGLEAMAQSRLAEVPAAWWDALLAALTAEDHALVLQATATVRALPVPDDRATALAERLIRIGDDDQASVDLRVHALAAVPNGLGDVSARQFELLCVQLGADAPPLAGLRAADVLARARLDSRQLSALCELIERAGPLELSRLLPAFHRSTDDALGRRLVAAMKLSPGLAALSADAVRQHLAGFSPDLREQALELVLARDVDAAAQQARLDQLLAALPPGDAERGRVVFNRRQAACTACHAVGSDGGRSGPDLTRIGAIRTPRDLVEAILFPNTSFVRSYEPVAVLTVDGQLHAGVLRDESADHVVLATGAYEEVRIARDQIDELRPGTVSLMPSGLEQQLSPQEMADLVEFLKSCR